MLHPNIFADISRAKKLVLEELFVERILLGGATNEK